MRTILIIALALVTGCSTPYSAGLHQYQNLEPGDISDIQDALSRLTDAPIAVVFVRVSGWADAPRAIGMAYLHTIPCRIELKDSLFTAEHAYILGVVVWHEYGHCVGLEHVPSKAGIDVMNPQVLPLTSYSNEAIIRFKTQVQRRQ